MIFSKAAEFESQCARALICAENFKSDFGLNSQRGRPFGSKDKKQRVRRRKAHEEELAEAKAAEEQALRAASSQMHLLAESAGQQRTIPSCSFALECVQLVGLFVYRLYLYCANQILTGLESR